MNTLDSLTPTQLAAVYNHHSDTPVKKFENRQKGTRRLLALLARIEVDPDDAIAAAIPNAKARMVRDEPTTAPTSPDIMWKVTVEQIATGRTMSRRLAAPDAETAGKRTCSLIGGPNASRYRMVTATAETATETAPVAAKPKRTAKQALVYTKEHLAALQRRIDAQTEAKAVDAALEPTSTPTPTVTGKARTLIATACNRPEGATSAELFTITGWKFASWSHQLKLITKESGTPHQIRKVDGTTRYFLTGDST